MSNLNIAVLGAGVIGVNTVLQLQEHFPSSRLTLIDDKFNDETLSYWPAGIFRASLHFGGMPEDSVRRWLEYSFRYYKDLQNYPDAGILELDGYIFSNISESNVKNSFLESIVPIYRAATADELNEFGSAWKYGSYFSTIRTKCSSFIPWTLTRFKQSGVNMKKCNVNHFSELSNDFDVVFNCTGLGAKYLCNDRHMVPIRGHLTQIYAPWIKKFYYNDVDTFVIPLGSGNVALGTCRDYENYNLSINKHDSASIMERCAALVPSITRAKILSEWVGLRPHRHILRIEIEKLHNIRIVHNYGHGGYGITSAPGTANYAVEEFRKSHLCNSKL